MMYMQCICIDVCTLVYYCIESAELIMRQSLLMISDNSGHLGGVVGLDQ